MLKDLDISIEMPATENRYGIKVHLSCYETHEASVDWSFSIIQWQTYANEFNDDVNHYLYNVWLTTDNDDLLEMLDKLKSIIDKL